MTQQFHSWTVISQKWKFISIKVYMIIYINLFINGQKLLIEMTKMFCNRWMVYKLWYIHIMGYYSAWKIKELFIHKLDVSQGCYAELKKKKKTTSRGHILYDSYIAF